MLRYFVTLLLQPLLLLVKVYHFAALQRRTLEGVHLVFQYWAFVVGVEQVSLRRLGSLLCLAGYLIERQLLRNDDSKGTLQDRRASLMVHRLVVLDTCDEGPHHADEHRVVELDDVHPLVVQIDFADNFVMERFIVGVDLLVLGFDIVELDVHLRCSAVGVDGADYHLVNMSEMQQIGMLHQQVLHGIEDVFGYSVVQLQGLREVGYLERDLVE